MRMILLHTDFINPNEASHEIMHVALKKFWSH